jgi:D-inositol-3-phosphate glycosyltransferase
MNVYVLQVARELGRLGNTVDVYTRYHDPEDPQIVELGDNARVVHLKAGPYFETKESLHRYIPEFLDSLLQFQRSESVRYDLVHSHYWLSGCAGIELSREWGVPHVTTFHTLAKTKMRARAGESEPQLRVSTEAEVASGVDAVVVSTEEEKADLTRLYGVPGHKVRVIPAGVDLELFQPVDKVRARQALGLTEDKVVLSVGRVEPLKGLDILVSAMAGLRDSTDARLVMVGGMLEQDGEIKRLQSLARALRIADRVTFTGAVKQAELPRYLSAADVFVMPSYHESFGLAALEAMACGVPVVASRVGGLKTFIRNGETGYLIPWHCPEPFAQRLEVLLANPSLRQSMGRAARAKAQTMGWEKAADRMMSTYRGLIEEPLASVAGA